MVFCYGLSDGKTKSITAVRAGSRFVGAVKTFKQMWQVFFREGLSGIVDRMPHCYFTFCTKSMYTGETEHAKYHTEDHGNQGHVDDRKFATQFFDHDVSSLSSR